MDYFKEVIKKELISDKSVEFEATVHEEDY